MNISCDVIKDLLPLYAEGMTSTDTNTLVEEHLTSCEKCAKELNEYNHIITVPAQTHSDQLLKIRKKLHIGVLWMVLRNCILAVTIIFGAIVLLTRPRVMSAEEAEIAVIENEEGTFIDFGKRVDSWFMKAGTNEDGDEIEYIALTAIDWILDVQFKGSNYHGRDIGYYTADRTEIPTHIYFELGSDLENVLIIGEERFLMENPYDHPFFQIMCLISFVIGILMLLPAWLVRKRKHGRKLVYVAGSVIIAAICTLVITGNNWLVYEMVGVSEYLFIIMIMTFLICFSIVCCKKVERYKKQGVLL